MDDYIIYSKLIFIGIFCGAIASVVGGGAEIIIVPSLIYLGIIKDYKVAIGTSLASLLLPIGIVAVYFYSMQKCGDVSCVKWKYALVLSLFFVVGTSVSYYTSKFDTKFLKILFGIIMVFLGILIIYEEVHNYNIVSN